MWHINSIAVASGASAQIWGGLAPGVGPRALGERLGPEGATYLVSIPNQGALLLRDAGADPQEWGIQVNGGPIYQYAGEGELSLSVDAANNVTISGGVGPPLTGVTLISEMQDIGVLLYALLNVIAGTPSLFSQWNSDPMALLYTAGFPKTSMINLGQTMSGTPDCCAQFAAWLKTIQFTEGEELDATRWSCILCKAGIAGVVAAAFVMIVAICVATGGTAGAALALEEATAVQAIATAAGLSVRAVAAQALRAFVAVGGAALVNELLEALCELMGQCAQSEERSAASPA